MRSGLGSELGQQVIVDNRGGAGGATAAEAARQAPPDGYTLFFGTMGTQAINPALYPKLRYDPLKDFAPISLTHITPRVLVVGRRWRRRTSAELIALAQEQARHADLRLGGQRQLEPSVGRAVRDDGRRGDAARAVQGQRAAARRRARRPHRHDLRLHTVYEEHIKAGKVRALGVTSKARMGALPQVPTIAEAGIAGYDVSNWLGVLAPAGTPKDVLATLHAALGRTMADAGAAPQLIALGIEPTFGTPEEFAALVRAELPKWAEVVRKSGVSVD